MKKFLSMMPLNGNKTYISGILAIVTGVVGLVGHFMTPDTQYAMDIEAAVTLIFSGIGMLGIGHKLDKMSNR